MNENLLDRLCSAHRLLKVVAGLLCLLLAVMSVGLGFGGALRSGSFESSSVDLSAVDSAALGVCAETGDGEAGGSDSQEQEEDSEPQSNCDLEVENALTVSVQQLGLPSPSGCKLSIVYMGQSLPGHSSLDPGPDWLA